MSFVDRLVHLRFRTLADVQRYTFRTPRVHIRLGKNIIIPLEWYEQVPGPLLLSAIMRLMNMRDEYGDKNVYFTVVGVRARLTEKDGTFYFMKRPLGEPDSNSSSSDSSDDED